MAFFLPTFRGNPSIPQKWGLLGHVGPDEDACHGGTAGSTHYLKNLVFKTGFLASLVTLALTKMPAMVAWLAAPIIRISFERWIRRAKKERQHQSASTAWTIEVVKKKKEPLIEFIGVMTALPVILYLYCLEDSISRWWPFGTNKSLFLFLTEEDSWLTHC